MVQEYRNLGRRYLLPVVFASVFLFSLGILVQNVFADSVTATVTVGGIPAAVGVNPNTNKIYVANDITNNVSVIDGTTNSVVSTIPVLDFPQGVGVNPKTNTVYVSNSGKSPGATNTCSYLVSIINGTTNS